MPGFRIVQLRFAERKMYTENGFTESFLWRHNLVDLTIAEDLRKRLMRVEGAIPQLAGIDM